MFSEDSYDAYAQELTEAINALPAVVVPTYCNPMVVLKKPWWKEDREVPVSGSPLPNGEPAPACKPTNVEKYWFARTTETWRSKYVAEPDHILAEEEAELAELASARRGPAPRVVVAKPIEMCSFAKPTDSWLHKTVPELDPAVVAQSPQ